MLPMSWSKAGITRSIKSSVATKWRQPAGRWFPSPSSPAIQPPHHRGGAESCRQHAVNRTNPQFHLTLTCDLWMGFIIKGNPQRITAFDLNTISRRLQHAAALPWQSNTSRGVLSPFTLGSLFYEPDKTPTAEASRLRSGPATDRETDCGCCGIVGDRHAPALRALRRWRESQVDRAVRSGASFVVFVQVVRWQRRSSHSSSGPKD